MKHVKMLSFAVMVAGVFMAIATGATTASATVLCREPGTGSPTGTTCPENQAYGAPAKIHAVNLNVIKLDTTYKTVECKSSTIQGETSEEGIEGAALSGSVQTFTFLECNCEVVVLKKGSFALDWTSGTHQGRFTSSGLEFTVQCQTVFGAVHCLYATGSQSLGKFTGGNIAFIDFEEQISALTTNALCAEEKKLTGIYEITTPKPLFITGET